MTAKEGIELKKPGAKAPSAISTGGGFPALVALQDGGMLAAWEEKGANHVERLP